MRSFAALSLVLLLSGCVTGTPFFDETTTIYAPDGIVESVTNLQIRNRTRVLFPAKLDKNAYNVRYVVSEGAGKGWSLQTGDMVIRADTGAEVSIGYGPYTLGITPTARTPPEPESSPPP